MLGLMIVTGIVGGLLVHNSESAKKLSTGGTTRGERGIALGVRRS